MLHSYTYWHILSEFLYILTKLIGGLGAVTVAIQFVKKKSKSVRILTAAVAVFLVSVLIYINHVGFWKEQTISARYDYSDYIYFGPIQNGLPKGRGRLFDSEKRLYYVGGFEAGKMDGEGTIYDGARKETGNFING